MRYRNYTIQHAHYHEDIQSHCTVQYTQTNVYNYTEASWVAKIAAAFPLPHIHNLMITYPFEKRPGPHERSPLLYD